MKEISKAYDPLISEDKIYQHWQESGFFNPDNLEGEPYSIMMPPPNVTGVLHLGHALENSLMDVMIRYQRMKGKKALLLPGTDHAAIATQAKVEKLLIEQGIKNPRVELGREKLLEKVREYSEQSKTTILSQIKKMGTSCDWSRLSYTFDEQRNKTVNEVFVRMYNDGLIYRGYRVVNWSVKGQSTCSDDELIYVDREAKLYTFKYSKDFPITIATTRPETKLGDTAVAVNPADERYQQYIGKVFTVEVGAAKPLEIKIISDPNVDPNFGTGALGVTPAHSSVDFEMFEKQKALGEPINLIKVIDEQGRMTTEAGENYAGLTVLAAREKFVGWLKENDLLEMEETIQQSVGTSDRFGDVIESLPMTQWFVDVNKKLPEKDKSLRELIKTAVEVGHNNNPEQKININPERFEKVFFHWINNLRDWCISRQIWWGHRIPAWYRGEEVSVGINSPEGEGWTQDEDTLDTWFSSSMWTFSTLDKPGDLETFHPTSWMQMGYEILFLWMVRMILMSTYTLDQIPFHEVYIHGMLRDEKGEKFSKSKGNNIDPLEMINKYGTDALRFSLISGITPGNDAKFYEEKVEGARNLVNKIWNIYRYIASNYELGIKNYEINKDNLTLLDKWIIIRINNLISTITFNFDNNNFSIAAESLRDFTWNDLADWYLEVSKFENSKDKNKVFNYVIENLLKLWHPFIPFVTEKIWSENNETMLLVEKWPVENKIFSNSEVDENDEQVNLIIDMVQAIRNARSENKVAPAKKIKAVVYTGLKYNLIKAQENLIKNLKTGIEEIEIKDKGEKIEKAIYITVGEIEIYLIGAVDEEKEKIRISKEIENLGKITKSLEMKLNNKDFVANAPEAIVNKEKEKLSNWKSEFEKLTEQLKNLK